MTTENSVTFYLFAVVLHKVPFYLDPFFKLRSKLLFGATRSFSQQAIFFLYLDVSF